VEQQLQLQLSDMNFNFFATALLALVALTSAQYIPVGPSTNPLPVSQSQLDRGYALVDEMVSRWTVLDTACSPNAPFALLYLNITNQSLVAIENGYFDDGNSLIDFILIFARRYLNAYDTFYNTGTVSTGAWREAFSYADSGRSSVLENLNQGINAHINFDLGIIVYNTSAYGLNDYNRVNDILNNVAEPANAGVAYRYDPTGTLSNPLIVQSTPIVVDAIVAARAASFTNGVLLLAQPNEAGRSAQISSINALTTVAAIAIESNRFGLFGSTAAARTSWCQSHRL